MKKRIFSIILVYALVLSLAQGILLSYAKESDSDGETTKQSQETPGDRDENTTDIEAPEENQKETDGATAEENQNTETNPDNKMRPQDETGFDEITTEADLRKAVADAGSIPCTIVLGDHISLSGSPLEIPAMSDITIEGTYQLRGAANQATITVGGTLKLDGITVTHISGQSGAGVKVNSGATLTLQSGAITGNTVTGNGGGIYNDGGILHINGGTVSGTVQGSSTTNPGLGGGIYNNGGTVNVKTGGTIIGTLSASNSWCRGGGIYNTGSGILHIDGGAVSGTARGSAATDPGLGAGIYNDASTVNVTSNGTVTGNVSASSPWCRGGGIYNHEGMIAVRSGAKVTGIAAGTTATTATLGMGGGIYNKSGVIHIETSGLVSGTTNNGAGRGGGICNDAGTVNIKSGGKVSGAAGSATGSMGGGIYNESSATAAATINIDGGTVSGNVTGPTSSPGMGGGIYNYKLNATAKDAVVTINTGTSAAIGKVSGTAGASGGGIRNNGGMVTINNLGMVVDSVAGFEGGGIDNGSGGSVTVNSGGRISGNKAANNGGGVFQNAAALYVNEGAIIGGTNAADGNTAGNHGGGIYTNNIGGTFTMKGSIIGNTAGKNGGGIYNGNTSALVIAATGLISENKAQSGGGIYDNIANVSIYGSILDNAAEENGGGIYQTANSSHSDTCLIKNAKITGNTAGSDGGGVYFDYPDLINLSIDIGIDVADPGTVFSNNTASQAYKRNPVDDSKYQSNIHSSRWSKPFRQGYNNFDISYKNGEPVSIFTVTIDFNDNTTKSKTHLVLSGDTLEENMPADPTRSGYTFTGWNIASDGNSTSFTKDTIVQADTTIYAQWKTNEPNESTPITGPGDNTQDSSGGNNSTTGNNATTAGTSASNQSAAGGDTSATENNNPPTGDPGSFPIILFSLVVAAMVGIIVSNRERNNLK